MKKTEEENDPRDFLTEEEKDSLTWALAFLRVFDRKYKRKPEDAEQS